MIRTQISLTDTQMRRLRRAARERHMSIAAVIREAVEQAIPDEDADRLARQRRAFELAGAFDSGQRDTAKRHDEILSEQTGW
jgi:Ribbon-helix-helix protein, copG family